MHGLEWLNMDGECLVNDGWLYNACFEYWWMMATRSRINNQQHNVTFIQDPLSVWSGIATMQEPTIPKQPGEVVEPLRLINQETVEHVYDPWPWPNALLICYAWWFLLVPPGCRSVRSWGSRCWVPDFTTVGASSRWKSTITWVRAWLGSWKQQG